MKMVERKIIHQCSISLSSLPGKNNSMSAHGAAQYHDEVREAIALNNKVMMFLLDGELEDAQSFAHKLTALVLQILISEGLTVTAAMDELRKTQSLPLERVVK